MICFFHKSDYDGICSGALIKMLHKDCEMIGINYGEQFPWYSFKKDERVFMVDFSLQPFDQMVKLNELCDLVWIDHHISAINEAKKHNFDLEKHHVRDGIGACQLVWEYLYPFMSVPLFVRLLALYDTWQFNDPRTLPFQYGLRVYNTNIGEQIWRELSNESFVDKICETGHIILKYEKLQNEKYAKACAFETEIDGLKAIAINRALTSSMLFESVWDNTKYDCMLAFSFIGDRWVVSLYTDKEGVDVSIVAKNRGGGGHKQASGFPCDALPFKTKL